MKKFVYKLTLQLPAELSRRASIQRIPSCSIYWVDLGELIVGWVVDLSANKLLNYGLTKINTSYIAVKILPQHVAQPNLENINSEHLCTFTQVNIHKWNSWIFQIHYNIPTI